MSTADATPLGGDRVLIVEDRYLIASEMAEEVERLGGRVVGPSRNLEGARAALAKDGADIALLDVSLDDEDVYPLASELAETGVPFIFLTGYDVDVLPVEWRGRPRIAKPVTGRALKEEILKLQANRARIALKRP
jgi:DNA-binding response OmpR family regulator